MDRAARARGQGDAGSGPIELGELRIDVERAELCVRGGRIAAQPLVVGLLDLLARARPRVLARRELCERLWPTAALADCALRACLAEARRLLRDAAADLWIETVPRRGYRLARPPH